MTIFELFAYGNEWKIRGNIGIAEAIWQDCANRDPMFGPAHGNLADLYRQQGNVLRERDELIKFMNCPITGVTQDLVPNVKNRLEEIDKQLNPQPNVRK